MSEIREDYILARIDGIERALDGIMRVLEDNLKILKAHTDILRSIVTSRHSHEIEVGGRGGGGDAGSAP